NDLVAHQLGGVPEILTLGELLKERRKNCFDLLRVSPAKNEATLVFGGDVMLGRSCAAKIKNGVDPFAGIAPLLHSASFAAANLECTISNLGDSAQRYAFRAPAQSAQLLRRSGFRAMGLANNHALDFGTAALEDCAAHLVQEQIEPIGVGKPGGKTYTPSFFSILYGTGAVSSRSLVCSLVCYGASTVEAWNRGALLQIGLNESVQVSSASLIPIVLEDGLPRADRLQKGKTLSGR